MNEFNPNHEGAEPNSAEPLGELQSKNGLAGKSPSGSPTHPFALRLLRAKAEIHAISQALELTGWNRRRAADLLSISYRGLLYKIRQYDITSSTTASQLEELKSVKVK